MRRLVFESLIELRRYDLFLRKHTFEAFYEMIRTLPVSTNTPETFNAEMICDAVAHACIWYPKHARCLQRSAVATILLRKYGIAAQFIIGTQRLPQKNHAWVEVGGTVVNDKPEVQAEYRILDRC